MSDEIKDSVDAKLETAKLEARRQRVSRIGNLLDQAAGVLEDMMQAENPMVRMRAAETAVNLYIQQENGERQDKMLEVQQRRLALEEAKLQLPGAQFNQTNVYLNGPQTPEEKEKAEAELLARKQAQDKLLASYLPKPPQSAEEVEETTTVEPVVEQFIAEDNAAE